MKVIQCEKFGLNLNCALHSYPLLAVFTKESVFDRNKEYLILENNRNLYFEVFVHFSNLVEIVDGFERNISVSDFIKKLSDLLNPITEEYIQKYPSVIFEERDSKHIMVATKFVTLTNIWDSGKSEGFFITGNITNIDFSTNTDKESLFIRFSIISTVPIC